MVRELRASRRARIFLAARMRASVGPARNVTIRNLSLTGALVECGQPPPPSSEIELSRAGLSAKGAVVWRSLNECGIQFDNPIDLGIWLPNAGPEDASLNEAPAKDSPAAPGAMMPDLAPRLVQELDYVSRLLEALGDDLSNDANVIARHGLALQSLDRSIQILGHLGAILLAQDPQEAIDRIGMEELRRRLSRKSL